VVRSGKHNDVYMNEYMYIVQCEGGTKCWNLYVDVQENGAANFVDFRNDALRVRISNITLLTFSSNALAKTILKIFCTLMECDVEQKI